MYKGHLWRKKRFVLGNKSQYPLFLGTVAGTILLYSYCDVVLLHKYCENDYLKYSTVMSQLFSLYFMFRINMTDPGVIIQNITGDRLCQKCNLFRPQGSNHCKYCEHCVFEMETHCFLMGTCIGRRNRRAFLLMVTNTAVGLYLLLGMISYRSTYFLKKDNSCQHRLKQRADFHDFECHLPYTCALAFEPLCAQVLEECRIPDREEQFHRKLLVKVNYMLVLLIIESILLVAYLWYVIHTHASTHVSFYVKSLTLVSWLISFSLIIILPLDIYFNINNDLPPDEESEDIKTMEIIWITLYWVIFFLTWFFLPLTLDYESAGEFTAKAKFFKSLKINLITYGVGLVAGLIFTIVLLVKGLFNFQRLLAFLVVLSNGFGLIIITFLLSYAIVAIPKKLFRETNHQIQLNSQYYLIAKTKNQLAKQTLDLEELAIEMIGHQQKYRNNEELRGYVDIILSNFNEEILENAKVLRNKGQGATMSLQDLTEDILAEMNSQSKELTLDTTRNAKKLEIATKQALFIEDVMYCGVNDNKILSSIRPERKGIFGSCLDRIQYLYYVKCWKYFMYTFSALFIALSALIVAGQLTYFIFEDTIFGSFLKQKQDFIEVQILVLIPLLFVLYCIQFGLLSIKFYKYGFYDYGYTDGPSLIFAATFISRIAFPLSFNFFWLFGVADDDLASVVGNFNFDEYLSSFKLALPILLVVLILCNIFDLYDKFMAALGFQRFQFSEDFDDDYIRDGQDFVDQQRKELANITVTIDIKKPLL